MRPNQFLLIYRQHLTQRIVLHDSGTKTTQICHNGIRIILGVRKFQPGNLTITVGTFRSTLVLSEAGAIIRFAGFSCSASVSEGSSLPKIAENMSSDMASGFRSPNEFSGIYHPSLLTNPILHTDSCRPVSDRSKNQIRSSRPRSEEHTSE